MHSSYINSVVAPWDEVREGLSPLCSVSTQHSTPHIHSRVSGEGDPPLVPSDGNVSVHTGDTVPCDSDAVKGDNSDQEVFQCTSGDCNELELLSDVRRI